MAWAIGAGVGVVLLGLAAYIFLFVPWGTRWGATPEELGAVMTGEDWLADAPRRGVKMVMTRAISIAAPPEDVWPWLAQLGRGAGWYSYDFVDNGRRPSARHIVSWIPAPRLGDAAAMGYLRHLDSGRELAWWVPGERWLGSRNRMVAVYRLSAEGSGARLVARYSGDTTGWSSLFVKHLFTFVDTLMARRQLLNIKERAERFGARPEDPKRAETGDRAQFQLYECIYAGGERCGVPGKEHAPRWRERAIEELGARMGLPSSHAV